MNAPYGLLAALVAAVRNDAMRLKRVASKMVQLNEVQSDSNGK